MCYRLKLSCSAGELGILWVPCWITAVMCYSYPTLVLAIIGFDFNQTTYSVREDAGSVAIAVSVRNGTPVGDVTVTLLTVVGGTSTGRVPKVCEGGREGERDYLCTV